MQPLKRIPTSEDRGGALGFTRTVTESAVLWSRPPSSSRPAVVPSRNDWFVGIAISAGISACVSMLALWLWNQNQVRPIDPVGQLTITYEPLEAREAVPEVAAPTQEGRSQAARPIAAPTDAGKPALVVISHPEGARVTINGLGYGSTPLTVADLPPGTKRLRLTKAGYESEERVVGADTTRAGVTLRITLREAPASAR